jgi:hypothetical protein
MKKVSLNKYGRGLFAALATAFFLVFCISCSNHEPNVYIDYYLTVKSHGGIFRRGGLPIDAASARIGNAVVQMQEKINEVYPDKNMEGNDAAVVAACRQVYYQYYVPDAYSTTMAIATLYRAVVSDGIIRQSKMVTTFTF